MIQRPQVAAFGYHEVTDDPTASGFQRAGAMPYKHTRLAFAQHLAQIEAGPAAPAVAVGDLDLLRGGRHLLLTFDDGGASALYIAEELSRRGWTGHFFIVTGRIGTPAFLSAGGIRELYAMGHVVGSHSHSHPNIFREQTFTQMLDEWAVSRDVLSQLLGAPVDTASVPGGHISKQVTASAALAGFRALFTCDPTLSPWQVGECTVFGRYLLKAHTPLLRVRQLAQFRGWTSARALRMAKEAVRHSMPTLYRAHVARSTTEWAPTQPLPDG